MVTDDLSMLSSESDASREVEDRADGTVEEQPFDFSPVPEFELSEGPANLLDRVANKLMLQRLRLTEEAPNRDGDSGRRVGGHWEGPHDLDRSLPLSPRGLLEVGVVPAALLGEVG